MDLTLDMGDLRMATLVQLRDQIILRSYVKSKMAKRFEMAF